MESPHTYSIEDWIVHNVFGIGQIMSVEVKSISGAKVQYFRIQTKDSTFWIPIDRMNSAEMRPLSTKVEIQSVIAVLHRPSRAMSSDYKKRDNAIRCVRRENKLEDIARLIRDLRARQLERGELNLDELKAMRASKQQLVEEWSIVTGERKDKVASRLDELVN